MPTEAANAVTLPATDFIAPSASVGSLARSPEVKSFVEGIQQAAQRSSIWVSIGVHEPPSAQQNGSDARQRCFNTQLLIDAQGDILARYRKIHLFDVDIKGGLSILESATTVPGSELEPPISTPIGKVGVRCRGYSPAKRRKLTKYSIVPAPLQLLTCYDLRFPEPSLRLRRQGCDVLTYPSAFTVRTGAAHWETLLRARAIETQSYVMAAAQVGSHAGTKRVS